MNDIQEKFLDRTTAIERAKTLSKTNPRVTVIEIGGEYYVETSPIMIRVWEKVIWAYPKN